VDKEAGAWHWPPTPI